MKNSFEKVSFLLVPPNAPKALGGGKENEQTFKGNDKTLIQNCIIFINTKALFTLIK